MYTKGQVKIQRKTTITTTTTTIIILKIIIIITIMMIMMIINYDNKIIIELYNKMRGNM